MRLIEVTERYPTETLRKCYINPEQIMCIAEDAEGGWSIHLVARFIQITTEEKDRLLRILQSGGKASMMR